MTGVTSRLSAALADRYRIERELGAGGMATVYLADDLRHQRKVAVKVLRPELAAALGHERFLREITTTAGLHHPHILPLYDSGEAGGFLFYVMPFVEGETLRDRLERETQLPLADALQIARETCDALAYAHSRGVIHRDIKPENILLESGHAVVADFGIATAVDVAAEDRLTETGLSIGTPRYMSPEQAAGERALDGRSDQYAVACVLYEMLAGEPPFTGPTAERVVHQHLAVEAPPVTNLRPGVPPAIAAALQRALAKTPADRFHPVTAFADALDATGATPPRTPSPAMGRRRLVLVAVTGAAVLVAGGLLLIPGGENRNGGDRPLESLAVLPLENLSAEPDQQYFADGMTDALITELSKIEALRVISRTSVMQYKGTRKPLPDIGAELGVDGIVEGSVLRDGNRVRVTAQLIDAGADRRIWGESYERDLGDVLALHRELARAIGGEVRVALTAGDRARLAGGRTVDPRAHDLLLQGQFHERRGAEEEAVALLEQATAVDPEYAAAWGALGRVYQLLGNEEPSYLPRARAAVRRALELDSNLAEVQTARGAVALYADWDWEAARRALERAITLNPGYDDAQQVYGDYYEVLGRWDEAIAAGERSKAVSPLSADMRLNLGITLTYAGRLDDAVRECRSAAELDSLSGWVYFCLADAYLRRGDFAEALTAAQTAARLDPSDLNRVMLAVVHAGMGRRVEAERVVGALEAEAGRRYVSPFHLAWIHAGLGHVDRALDDLERAVAVHAAWTPWVNNVPAFDTLRAEPRFQAVLRRMNLPARS